MILVSTDYISGKELKMLGLVQGSTIQSKKIGRDITQSFKTIVGGELKAYTEMMNEAGALATKHMEAEAESLGADACYDLTDFIGTISLFNLKSYIGITVIILTKYCKVFRFAVDQHLFITGRTVDFSMIIYREAD